MSQPIASTVPIASERLHDLAVYRCSNPLMASAGSTVSLSHKTHYDSTSLPDAQVVTQLPSYHHKQQEAFVPHQGAS
jgi:hypothetical protein